MASPSPRMNYTQQNVPVPSTLPSRICILGQSNVTGISGLYTNLENYSISDLEAKFGATQHITKLLREVIYNYSQQIVKPSVWAYVKADNVSGVATVKKVTATGTATKTGTYAIKAVSNSVANNILAYYNVTVGDNVTTITAARKATLDKIVKLPFTTDASAGVLTLTAVNKGTHANSIPLWFEEVPGITDAITIDTLGSVDPDFTDIISNIDIQNSKIDVFSSLLGYADTNVEIQELLLTRSSNILQTNNADLNGTLVFSNSIDPISEAEALSETSMYSLSRNGLNTITIFNKKINPSNQYHGDYIFCAQDELAVNYAMVFALRKTIGTNTSLYLQNEVNGRPANVKIPLHNTILPYAATPLYPNYNWKYNEIDIMDLYHFGVMTFNGTYTILNNMYTLSDEAQYAKVETRWQYFVCREFLSAQISEFLKQKSWNYGIANDNNETDKNGMTGQLQTWYQILSGTNVQSQFLTYFSGIIDNSSANYDNFTSILEKTLDFKTLVINGIPRGVLSATLFLTPTMQIDNISITQQNNLISA